MNNNDSIEAEVSIYFTVGSSIWYGEINFSSAAGAFGSVLYVLASSNIQFLY
jgi:hypothetical protein